MATPEGPGDASGLLSMTDEGLAIMGRKIHRAISPSPLSADELRDRIEEDRSLVTRVYERVIDAGPEGLRQGV